MCCCPLPNSEREVTGERIRDKIAASKKKGMWMGGNPPLGYRVSERALVIDAAGAERRHRRREWPRAGARPALRSVLPPGKATDFSVCAFDGS